MEWYSGSVAQAIARAQQEGGVLALHLVDGSAVSQQSAAIWNSAEVINTLEPCAAHSLPVWGV